MEDAEPAEDTLNDLTSLRQHRMEWVKGRSPLESTPDSRHSPSHSMRQVTNHTLSDVATRLKDARKVIETAHNSRLEDDIRRLVEEIQDLSEDEISAFEKRAQSAEERHQKIEMESRLAIEERRIRDRFDLERRIRVENISSEVRNRVSTEIDREFKQRLASLEMRIRLEHESEIERLERRLELELSETHLMSANAKLEAKKIELETEMRERLRLYRRRREIEISDRIEEERRRTYSRDEKRIKDDIRALETTASSEIDEDLAAWYSAERRSTERIAKMRKKESLLTQWAEFERKIQENRASRILDLRTKLRRLEGNETSDHNVDELVDQVLSEWDGIVEKTILKLNDQRNNAHL